MPGHGQRRQVGQGSTGHEGAARRATGEAREADLGIAGGKGQGLLFRRGEVVRKVPQSELADALVEEALSLAEERKP